MPIDMEQVMRNYYRDCKHLVQRDQCKCAWDHQEKTGSFNEILVDELWYGVPLSNYLKPCDYIEWGVS